MSTDMRNIVWVVMLAAGCQAPFDPNAKYDVVAVDGEVSTSGRNFWTDGIPNPDVCVDFAGTNDCTGQQTQTYDPSWHKTLVSGVVGTTLMATPLAIDYVDRGIFHDVQICSGSVAVTEQWLRDGGFSFNCNNGSHANFALRR